MSTENQPTDNTLSPAPQPSQAPAFSPADFGQDNGPFTAAQLALLGEDAIKRGASTDTIHAALKASGVEVAPDSRTDTQKIFDRAYYGPEDSAGKSLNVGEILDMHNQPGQPALSPEDRTAVAAEWESFAEDMAMPNEITRSVVDMAYRAAAKQTGMSEGDRAAWREQEKNILAQSFSPADLAKWVPIAREVIAETRIGQSLLDVGAFNDAASLRLIIHHLMHLEARPKA